MSQESPLQSGLYEEHLDPLIDYLHSADTAALRSLRQAIEQSNTQTNEQMNDRASPTPLLSRSDHSIHQSNTPPVSQGRIQTAPALEIQSTGQSVAQSVDASLDESVDDLSDYLSDESTTDESSESDLEDEMEDEEPRTPVHRAVSQPIDPNQHRVVDAIEYSVKQSVDRTNNQPINQTVIPPFKPVYHTLPIAPIDPSIIHSTRIPSITRSFTRSVNHPYLITRSHRLNGWDMQNIDWIAVNHSTHQSANPTAQDGRNATRRRRDASYPRENHVDGLTTDISDQAHSQAISLSEPFEYYSFQSASQAITPVSFHFQLRHLVHAMNAHDVISLSFEGKVSLVNQLVNQPTSLFDCEDLNKIVTSLGVMKQSANPSSNQILFVGGRDGELWVIGLDPVDQSDDQPGTRSPGRLLLPEIKLTNSDAAITNAITCSDDIVYISSNDNVVRCMDVSTMQMVGEIQRPVPINYSVANPYGNLLLTVGDAVEAWLFDANTRQCVAELPGHTDHSFSGAWHPNGIEFVTASQDCTARVWDIRFCKQSVSVLSSRISPIRSIKYSHDGQFLIYAEAADYMHIRSTQQLQRGQLIDFFGEVNGFDVSSDDSTLFFGVCDSAYGGMMEWRRNVDTQQIDIW